MTLTLAQNSLARLQQEREQMASQITEAESRIVILDAQIGAVEKVITDNTPAPVEATAETK